LIAASETEYLAHKSGLAAVIALSATPADATAKEPPLPWRPINECPDSDDWFWFMRGDTVDGPRLPAYDDADYWDWFAPCEAPPTRAALHPARQEKGNGNR
jgi:hypothetical protein